jgi:hypothetical protein
MERTRRRQGYLERFNSKTGKWERTGRTKPTAPSAKPAPAKPAPAKPAAKPAATKPNPYTSGKPNPNAAVRGVIGGKPQANVAVRGAKTGLSGALLTAAAAKAAEVLGKAANPKEWDRVSAELKDRGYGSAAKPVKKDPNNRSSTGIRISDKENQRDYKAAPTGSQQYNDYRNKQIAAERERLKGVGNPPKPPKPPAAKPQATRPAASQTSRPAAPASPKKPATPTTSKDRRVSAATANREAGNYGTSRTNNPMIDDAMKARMRQREDAAGVGPVKDGARYAADIKNSTKGVGPIKDGDRYASNLKPADKTKSEKGMTLAERMRRRRQSGMT